MPCRESNSAISPQSIRQSVPEQVVCVFAMNTVGNNTLLSQVLLYSSKRNIF